MLVVVGALSLGGLVLVTAVGLGLYSHHSLGLARRSCVGARSEDEVGRAFAPLRSEGWSVRRSLAWRGRGDVDLLATAPGGIAFVVEVKTSGYLDRHLVMVREPATWLWRFRRRWCRHDVVPVMCVARARGVYRWEEGVLVVSIDRLIPTVRGTANLVHSG